MLALAADENFKQQIINGLRRKLPDADCRAIREVGLSGASDPEVLAWAAKENRIVVTHDTRTMAAFAYERVADREPMPGVIEVPDLMSIGEAIEELVLLVQLMAPDEIKDRVLRLPL